MQQQEARAPPLFVETLPIIGQVPMVFFIPKNDKEYADLKIMIERYGGMVTDIHECFTYQILPIGMQRDGSKFFAGDVFSAKWLIDSVKQCKLLSNDCYLEYVNQEINCLRIDFHPTRTRFNIREGIKIFELGCANPAKSSGSAFW